VKKFLLILFLGGLTSLTGLTGQTTGVFAKTVVKYQCSMHPQIVRDKPGDCPICGMHLEKVELEEAGIDAATAGMNDRAAFRLSAERQQLIGVKTGQAEMRDLERTVELPARVTEKGLVEGQLLEIDAGQVKAGMRAVLTGPKGQSVPAIVVKTSAGLDGLTRSFSVLLKPSNAAWLLPGVFCQAEVRAQLGRRLTVAREALVDTGDSQVVFVMDDQTRFAPKAVRVGERGEDWVEIRSGLKAGEQVVTSANFLIDSESRFKAAAAQFGEGK
jgi:multidrug efflux pump subunit AcrA (membrane-fusion protein)